MASARYVCKTPCCEADVSSHKGDPDEAWTEVGDHVIFSRQLTTGALPGPPTVVLVHGYVVSSRYMVPTMIDLAPHYRVIAPDLPGWGRSTRPSRALDVATLADVLTRWASALQLYRPIFVGHSFGCQIVANLAAQHPQSLSALILVGPTVDSRARTVLQQASRLLRDLPRERPSLWLIEVRDLLSMGPAHALQSLRIMLDDRMERVLPRIDVPTLVVRNGRDPIAPQRWVEEVANLLPYGEFLVLLGAPHASNYSTPEGLVRTILPFIARPTPH